MPLLLSLVVLLPLLPGVVLTYLAGRSGEPAHRGLAAWIAGIVSLLALLLLIQMAPAVFAGQTLLLHADWVPQVGLNIGFRLDGLSLLFAILITGIGVLIVLYTGY